MSNYKIIVTCRNCGFDNPKDTKKCNSCATSFTAWDGSTSDKKVQWRWICPDCYAKNMKGNKTCHNCEHQRSNEGCFITTAVCLSLGKHDNCYELNMARNYRDNWVQKNYPDLINRYYAIAPKIVSTINSSKSKNLIYKTIWDKYLKTCLNKVEKGDFEDAKIIYETMLKELIQKYPN